MKKIFYYLSLLLLLSISLTVIKVSATEVIDVVEVNGSTYEVTSNVINTELGYGIKHIKDIALSSASDLHTLASCGPMNTKVGQQVNVIEVPSNEATRIVNWTYMVKDGWSKQTVRSLAENFEYHNPGWKVIAAVNGDFFDINGKQALQYQGNGTHVSNNEVYRPANGTKNVGFLNDGSAYPLVGGKTINFGPLTLDILDENENIIKQYVVDKINEEVVDSELGVWFSYFSLENDERKTITITAPANTYLAKTPVRCLPISKTTVYGKGSITKTTEAVDLFIGQFALQTTNSEIVEYLNDGRMIRVQQNVIGDYANCDNITGCGAQLLVNGDFPGNDDKYRHPRTIVGIKADGTISLITVDGRQFETNMYGMCYSELAATLKYYGCVEGYNLDGGGSTTVITRNEYGDFDVHNSPSDGGERSDSNALLVVVPDVNLTINNVTHDTIDLTYNAVKDISIEKLSLDINGKITTVDTTKLTDSAEIKVDGLVPETKYNLTYTYDLKYKNSKLENISSDLYFSTGKVPPIVKNCYYSVTENDYVFYFDVTDEAQTISYCSIKYDKRNERITEFLDKTITIPKSSVKTPSFEFVYKYNLKSSKSSTITKTLALTEVVSYKINYDMDENVENYFNPSYYATEGLPLRLNEPYLEGYKFEGWYFEDHLITSINGDLKGDITITPKFSYIPKTFNITYECSGTHTNPLNYTEGSELVLTDASLDGYRFDGWFLNDEKIEKIDATKNTDLTLVARFTYIPKVFNITYDSIGTHTNPLNYTEGETIKLEDAVLDGYLFKGWILDGTKVTELKDLTGDITLTAEFEKLDVPTTKKGCGCKKNAIEAILTYTTLLTLLAITLKKKQ